MPQTRQQRQNSLRPVGDNEALFARRKLNTASVVYWTIRASWSEIELRKRMTTIVMATATAAWDPLWSSTQRTPLDSVVTNPHPKACSPRPFSRHPRWAQQSRSPTSHVRPIIPSHTRRPEVEATERSSQPFSPLPSPLPSLSLQKVTTPPPEKMLRCKMTLW